MGALEIIRLILAVIYVLVCVALVIIVLFQNSKQQGLSGAIAGTAETFFGKNKGRTIDAKLKRLTTIGAIVFLVFSLVLAVLVVMPWKK